MAITSIQRFFFFSLSLLFLEISQILGFQILSVITKLKKTCKPFKKLPRFPFRIKKKKKKSNLIKARTFEKNLAPESVLRRCLFPPVFFAAKINRPNQFARINRVRKFHRSIGMYHTSAQYTSNKISTSNKIKKRDKSKSHV